MSEVIFDQAIKDFLERIGEDKLYNPNEAIEKFYSTQPALETKHKDKKVIQVDLPESADRAIIVPLYDVHIGAKTCYKELFLRTVDYILKTPNCYTVIGGDILESATRQSVGLGIFDEEFHLTDQMRLVSNILKPLADQGKILGAVTGNHEMRTSYFNGFNPIAEISHNLGIPYLQYQGFIVLKVGSQEYKIFFHHGTGSGRTKGAKVNSSMRLNTVALADLYISGHIHDRFAIPDAIFDIEDGVMVQKTRYYVAAGSFLQYFGGYPEMQLLSPASVGTLVIELMGDQKAIRVHY